MKSKFTLLVAFMLMATTTMLAQGFQRQTVPERVKTAMDKIKGPLHLDQSQAEKTDSIFTEFYSTQNKMREDARASGNRPGRSVYQKMMTDRDEKLKAIFTAEQYTKFKNEVEDSLRPQIQTHEGNN